MQLDGNEKQNMVYRHDRIPRGSYSEWIRAKFINKNRGQTWPYVKKQGGKGPRASLYNYLNIIYLYILKRFQNTM